MTGTIHPHYLIDTVAAIARLNGDETFEVALDPQATLSIPIIVLGELYAGAENSAQAQRNIEKIDQLIGKTTCCYVMTKRRDNMQKSSSTCAEMPSYSA
jgi:tRNA(fMet)-specific endonuclease VapC